MLKGKNHYLEMNVNYKVRVLFLVTMLLTLQALIAKTNIEETIPYAWEERFTQTAPPVAPVRPIAEFEPASHVMIRYPLGIPTALVAQLSNTADVICLVSSNNQQNAAISSFTNAGVNMARVSFMTASTDSYWTRDYAPWFLFDGNGEYGVLDFQYNRPRPGDNMVPQVYANTLGLPYYGMNMQQTGGNYMTDGINTAVQTHIAYTENGNNQANVNSMMLQYLGISNYIVVQDPNNTYIDHIDCWGKFLAPDKVLIRSVPTSHSQYNSIESIAQFFATQTSAWGYPYRVYRVYTPQNQPYTNSLILNKRVFVPIMNSTHDAAALQVYAEAMPGYEIIGVPGSPYTPWESTDALHCRTHEIPDADMLHIAHSPYHGVVTLADEYPVLATLIPHSGSELDLNQTNVVFRINSGEWQHSPLIQDIGYSYSASISGHAPGDTIRYYIQARDQSSRLRQHPEFAELDPHEFVVFGDNSAPDLVHYPPCSIGEVETTFVVNVTDDSGIKDVWIQYTIDSGDVLEAKMLDAGNGLYLFTFEPDFNSQQQFFMYRIAAMDFAENTTWLPGQNHWYSIPITYLDNADDVLVSVALSLSLYPNPFKTGAQMVARFSGKLPSVAKARIYNVKGQMVYEEILNSGAGEFRWNGLDKRAQNAGSGVYFLSISGTNVSLKRKFIITN